MQLKHSRKWVAFVPAVQVPEEYLHQLRLLLAEKQLIDGLLADSLQIQQNVYNFLVTIQPN